MVVEMSMTTCKQTCCGAFGVVSLLTAVFSVQGQTDFSLSMANAERLALEQDTITRAYQANEQALKEGAVAEKSLPDPKLKLGLMNFPTDTFRRDQEPMTQVQLGIVQAFPRGSSRSIKSEQKQAKSRVQAANVKDRNRTVLRSVREDWLEVYYWVNAGGVVNKTRALFDQLVEVTEGQYAVGRRNQQDYIQAQLELGMLDDREIKIRNNEEKARTALARWIGPAEAQRPIPVKLPVLTVNAETDANALLNSHPLVNASKAQVNASQHSVDLAKQQYKPRWLLDVTYGFRDGNNPDGSERADFLSAKVLFDMPLFTNNRQDRRLQANRLELNAAQFRMQDLQFELRKQLDAVLADKHSFEKRIALFQQTLLPRARENATAALNAYQVREGDFSALVRARITELETELNKLRLQVDRAKVQAKLIYLLGETS